MKRHTQKATEPSSSESAASTFATAGASPCADGRRPPSPRWPRLALLGALAAAFLLIPAAYAAAVPITVDFTGGPGTGGNITGVHVNQEGQPVVIDCDYDGFTVSGDCVVDTPFGEAGEVRLTVTTDDPDAIVFVDWTRTHVGLASPVGCETGSTDNPCFIRIPGFVTSATVTANLAEVLGTPEVAFPALDPPPLDPVGDLTDSQAAFQGRVNPNGSEVTACRFEWVKQSDPQGFSSGEVDSEDCIPGPVGIGDGNDFVDVEATATGLEPNTTYRVRLLASKAAASPSTVSEEADPFTTDAVPPDDVATGSAWSITDRTATLEGTVNPRNSATVFWFEYVTESGFQASGFDGAQSTDEVDAGDGNSPVQVTFELGGLSPFTAYRFRIVADNGVEVDPVGDPGNTTAAGSDTTFATRPPVIFPTRGYELVSAFDTNGNSTNPEFASPDGNHVAYAAFLPVPGTETGFVNSSRFRASRNPGDGSWTQEFMSAPNAGSPMRHLYSATDFSTTVFRGISGDARRKVAGQPELTVLFDAVPGHIAADGSRVVSGTGVREWRDGETEFLDIQPGSEDRFGSSALGSGLGTLDGTRTDVVDSSVSRDGLRVAFTAGSRVYVRLRDEAQTVEASDGSGAHFWGADADLRTVLYARDGGLDAYHVDEDSRTTVAPTGSNVMQVLDVSEDGRRAYFVAGAALAAGADSGDCQVESDFGEGPFAGTLLAGTCNLYLAELAGPEDPVALTYVATADLALGPNVNQPNRHLAASPDGSVLAFRALDSLVPGRQSDGKGQVYVYEADRDELSCASCPLDGSAPTAYAQLTPGRAQNGVPRTLEFKSLYAPHVRNVSSDGSVFFQTVDSLLPADTNGRMDVYEWRGGRLDLISAGTGPAHSFLGDASRDGSSVFFASTDQWVQGVPSGVSRIYAARVGGGFIPPLGDPPCTGEDCLPVAPPQPEDSAPPTGTITGPGNVAGECNRLQRAARGARQRARGLRQRARGLRQRARRQARRGNAQRAKRLRQRANRRVGRRARSQRQRAQRLRAQARECRQEREERGGER